MKLFNKFLVVLTILAALFSMNATASKVLIVRTLPAYSFPESTFTVTLTMDINESESLSYFGLYEYYPSGWTVTNISCGGVRKTDHIEWLIGFGSCSLEDKNITYIVHVPISGNGTYRFNGNVLSMDNTTGDDNITIVPYQITFTRDLPSTAYTNSNISVSLNMDVSEESKPNILSLVEYIPLGWTVSDISNGGITKNASIEWSFSPMKNPVQDTNLSYVLSVPGEAAGTYQFSGQFNYTGDSGSFSERTIGVDRMYVTTTTTVQCALIGDVSPCGVVEMAEVMALINQWAADKATLNDVIALIIAWMSSI